MASPRASLARLGLWHKSQAWTHTRCHPERSEVSRPRANGRTEIPRLRLGMTHREAGCPPPARRGDDKDLPFEGFGYKSQAPAHPLLGER